MLTIFAKSFMTATRTDAPPLRDGTKSKRAERCWLPSGHWWLQPDRRADLRDL